MLYLGKQITSSADVLQPITEEELLGMLQQPQSEICSMIEQLRIVRSVDEKQYSVLKRQLPYIVCGTFNPSIRRTENFAYIDKFFVDLDHLSVYGQDACSIRMRLLTDNRVLLCFVSPSQDGLKLLFRLKERCYDAGLFSLFYKAFVHKLTVQYDLEQLVDTRTSDVTRACFLSWDKDAHYNPLADAVDINDFINTRSPQTLFEQKRAQDKAAQQTETKQESLSQTADPDSVAVARIKEILSLQRAKTVEKSVYVPEEVSDIMDKLTEYLTSLDVQVDAILPIQYGQKIRCTLEGKHGECNIFYGKRGFSVVISPRGGTDSAFNGMLAELIKGFLIA